MPVGLLSLFFVITLLVSNVFRHVLALLLRATSGGLKKDYGYLPSVSILLPSYNEGRTVYDTVESISRSNYPLGSFEVIARDDCSVDDTYDWLLRAQNDFTNVKMTVQRNPVNSGKAHTVFAALESSSAEIILSIDSDCIFDRNAIRELVACFADPKVGGVGGVVGVRNVNENVLTMVQTFVYYTCFHFLKALETWSRTVTCISGCMFAVRRDLMVKLAPDVLARNWFGIPVNDGEDRFLTHKILLAGYGTVINTSAQCWTTVPNNLRVLFKQQIRWQRSGIRDFFLTLRTLPRHVSSIHPNALYSQLVPTLAALASVIVVLVLQAGQFPYAIAPAVLIFYAVLGVIFHIFTLKFNPEQKVSDPLSLLSISAWIIVGRLIEILALFTLDSRDWGTRAKKQDTASQEQAPVLEKPAAASSGLLAGFACSHSGASSSELTARKIANILNGGTSNAMVEQVHPPVL